MAKRKGQWTALWVLGGLVVLAILASAQIVLIGKSKAWFDIDPNILGDSFGALNAVISGLAFVGFIITLIMQGRELSLQREELEETRRELRGSRQAQEAQVQMSLQAARVASLAAILNHKFHQFTAQPAQRQYINIEMNRWNAELEAEITAMHHIGVPWQAANAMLHSAATEIASAQQSQPPVTLALQMPNDLPVGLAPALASVESLLDAVHAANSTCNGQQFHDANDPLKPVVRAWLFKARECLRLAIRQEEAAATGEG